MGDQRTGVNERELQDTRLMLATITVIFLISLGWWALALWPVPGGNPAWLDRARVVCFNAGPDGLPDVSGWMMLIGQPLLMYGFLVVVWPRGVLRALGWAFRRPVGVVGLGVAMLVVVGGLAWTGARVSTAMAARAPVIQLPQVMTAEEHPRLDWPSPELGLRNQHGEVVTLAHLEGRPAFVTFAFGNCHDICPVVVEQARSARDEAWGPEGAALVVVTLDPWRDTPARLPALATRWGLEGPHDHLLGGSVEEVEAVLDAWNVARVRNAASGEVAHPSLTYVLAPEGGIAFATLSGREVMLGLADRVGGGGSSNAGSRTDPR
jgi:protein SCO1